MLKSKRTTILALFAMASGAALAGPLTPGNIVIYRVGDGSAALTSAATAAFLDEYTTAGVFVQSIPVPIVDDGSNQACTSSGSATSEGFLFRATDGQSIAFGGYDAPVGTAAVAGTTSATFNRVFGIVKPDGTLDTSSNVDAYSAGNPRSVATVDGLAFWTGGSGSGSGVAATGGTRYSLAGAGQVSSLLSSTITNIRVVKIFNGQLYATSGSANWKGVNAVGTGIPTAGDVVTTLLPGFDGNTTSTASPYDFAFVGTDTLYVADDRTLASGGGLQKWTFDGVNWVLQYTITAGLTGTNGIRGMIAVPDAGGNIIYATSGESNANNLVRMVDTGAGSTFSVVATAAINTRFRGLSMTPESATSTETLAPTAEQFVRGQGIAGTLASWAADDADPRNVRKFIVINQTEAFIRVNLDYTTTKANPTAISFVSKARMLDGGVFRISMSLRNDANAFVEVLPETAIGLSFATFTGNATGTLTDYVQAAGAMRGQIAVRQAGPSTAILPRSSFETGNMVVTG